MKSFKRLVELALYHFPANLTFDYFVSIAYFLYKQKYFPNIVNPSTFNEHMLRIKLSSESFNPLRQYVCDKEFVKDYVHLNVGNEYNVHTLAILSSPNEVRDFTFPDRCVIKPTHMSGKVIIRRSTPEFVDIDKIIGWLGKNYYRFYRESNYKHLHPKIIVEELLETSSGEIPKDYKIFCFQGKPLIIQIDVGRFGTHTRNFYTCNWDPLTFTFLTKPRSAKKEDAPGNLNEMLSVAARLSRQFNFIRVDLYSYDGKIKVGELTSFPGSCIEIFTPFEADRIVGRLFVNPDLGVLTPLISYQDAYDRMSSQR